LNKKLGIIISIAVLAALLGGITALWYEELEVEAVVDTAELDWEFTDFFFFDSCYLVPGPDKNLFDFVELNPVTAPEGKDVGCTLVEEIDTDNDGDFDMLNVTLNNTYPYYYTAVNFWVHNNGEVPLKVWRLVIILDNGTQYVYTENEVADNPIITQLDLNNDGKPDVFLWFENAFGDQLEPCQTIDISMHITVLQPAPQNETLHFQLTLDAVTWNEYAEALSSE